LITSGGMGTMGYALPAAVGAKMALQDEGKDTTVIATCGDGSFQMVMMELATMQAQQLPLKIVLFVNDRLGMVREVQDKAYGHRQIAVHLDGSPEFAQLAKAYGIESRCLDASEPDLEGAIEQFIAYPGAYLLEVRVSPNESTL
jgi:acetolactate synthase-1/2/3 large subunit